MAFVSGSPAPLRDVKWVQFGVLSPDELVSISLTQNFSVFLMFVVQIFFSAGDN